MKLNKKLLVFLLSLCLLVGAFALSALAAAGDADVLTLKYQDGTVQTYKLGDAITAPAVPKDFIVYDGDGKAYKYTTAEGAAWQGIPTAVTEAHLGQTVDVTVEGTKDPRQVYYMTWETISGNTAVVYHMNNDVHQYLSSANKGDKGDGSNTGANSFSQIFPAVTENKPVVSLKIKLYADVEASSFATALSIPPPTGYTADTNPYRRSAIRTDLDLNGHTVINKATGSFMDFVGVDLRIYSTVPGAHWYQTGTTYLARANNDSTVVLGDVDSSGKNADNISFHCKGLVGQLYGNGAHIYGGKYYQSGASSSGGFLNLSRRIYTLSNAEFYPVSGQAVFTDIESHNSASTATGSTAIKNCVFYAESNGKIITATQTATPKFENCAFLNFVPNKTQDTATVDFKSGCVFTNASSETFSGGVFAKVDPYAYEGLVGADGNPIVAYVNYAINSESNVLKITTDQGSAYYTIGATFSTDAGDAIKIEGVKLYKDAIYEVANISQIKDGKVVSAGAVNVGLAFRTEDVLAFTYYDNNAKKLYAVGYNTDCNGTAAGVFDKFYELFNNPASAYEIKMYKDLEVTKAVPFGPLKNVASNDEYNRDYYNSLVNGSIVWDLNGHTVTIAENSTFVNLNAANYKGTNSATQNGSFFAIFGLEGENTNSFTVKSSVAGGKVVNLSPRGVFGVGEGRRNVVNIEGANLTVESNGQILFGFSPLDDKNHFNVNGGTYIYHGTEWVLELSGIGTVIQDATFIATKNVQAMIGVDLYRSNVYTITNCIFSAPNAASFTRGVRTYSSSYFGTTCGATVTDSIFVNVVPTANLVTNVASPITYAGTNVFNSEANLALAYASAPDGTAKYTLSVGVPNVNGGLEAVTVYGYAKADQIFAVTYEGADVTVNYLVGKYLVPLAMQAEYYTVTFDFANGTANIPVAWAGVVANSIVSAGGTATATPAENNVAIAFALYDNVAGKVVDYVVSDSDAIADALASALAAQANAGKLYVYKNLAVDTLTVAKELQILLSGQMITISGALSVNAPLTVEEGTIVSLSETPFVLSADVSLNNTAVYLAEATVVFSGTAGNASLVNVVLLNLDSVANLVADGVTASYNGGKVIGVTLGAGVTASGEILGTAGTFAEGCAYGSGVFSGLIVNNKSENLIILGQYYPVDYAEAITEDDSKALDIVYMYDGVVRGTQSYLYGSIPYFYREFAEGYYFEYVGVNTLITDATVNCIFKAADNKLKAQIILTDALNYTFFLKVEASGVLANLKINGEAIDFASLAIKNIDGEDFYVIPIVFNSFADAINDFVLSVDLVSPTDSMTITAVESLDAYLAELLANGNEEEAKKAYAVAEYVVALVDHFEYRFAYNDARAKNMGELNILLADYEEYRISAILPEANEALASAYIESVALVVKEQVVFAFRVIDGFDGTLEVNGVAQAVSQPFDGFERDYVLANVSLADLDESITITVKDAQGEELESFTYSLADYVAGTAVQNEGATGAYAKALWNLCAALG